MCRQKTFCVNIYTSVYVAISLHSLDLIRATLIVLQLSIESALLSLNLYSSSSMLLGRGNTQPIFAEIETMKRRTIIPFLVLFITVFGCKKDDHPNNPVPPPPPPPHNEILLKDIVHAGLPSPYYHFEYDTAERFVKASFLSGQKLYNISHAGNKLSGIKNNTMVNKDSIGYEYDNTGKADYVKVMDENGIIIRRAFLSYQGNQLIKIEWERRIPAGGYVAERIVNLSYYQDGNLKELTSNRPPFEGQTEVIYTDRFEDYDDKVNADGFRVFHEETEHLILLPGIVIQKNNPRKAIRTSETLISYIANYTFTYNDKKAPVTRIGNVTVTNGQNQGSQFTTTTSFTYY